MAPTASSSSSRLDNALVERGLCASRSRARDAIRRGHVLLNDLVALKPSHPIREEDRLALDDPAASYVSRAALKLIAALDAFGFDPVGRTCIDLGASTGGFSQVLLERGAARIYAVDVGHGQLHQTVEENARLVALEGRNARTLTREDVPEAADAVVADLSFIPLRTALPAALALLARHAWLALLVKPQFEVGPAHVGKGGLVRDQAVAQASVAQVAEWLEAQGWRCEPPIPSPIPGGDGNTEYLLGASRDG